MNAEASTSQSQQSTPVPTHSQPQPMSSTSTFRTPAIPVDSSRDPTTHPAFPPPPRMGSSFPRQGSFSGIGGMFSRGNGQQQGNGMGVGAGSGHNGNGPVMGTWSSPTSSQETTQSNGHTHDGNGENGSMNSNGQGGSGPMGISALSALMRNGNGSPNPPPQPQNSPNFPSQLSPYSQPFALPYGSIGNSGAIPMSMGMSIGNMAMGSLSNHMGMGMSISPTYGQSGAGGMSFGNFGSYMQQGGPSGWNGQWGRQRQESFGAGGTGAERSRELEAKYVRDFTCCGLKLGGLHDLLEHYEECHVHLAPDLRKHSLTLANMESSSIATQTHQQQVGQPPGGLAANGQNTQPSTSFPSVAPSPFAARAQPTQAPTPMSAVSQPSLTKQSSPANSDAPGTPGMMDIDMMDEDEEPHAGGSGQGQGGDNSLHVLPSILPPTAAQWNAFQPPANVPQCVPPSLLSYNIPPSAASGSGTITPNRFPTVNGFGFAGSGMNFGGSQPASRDRTPGAGGSNGFLTEAQKAERAARKAARKEAKRIAKENGEYRSSDEDEDGGKRKKYRCPVEGCNKAYKQANGLKYHLNRSINSSHGHLANMPIPPPT